MVQGILGDIDLRGLTPSYSLAVIKNSRLVFLKSYPDFLIYDCASITKPLITFPLAERVLDLKEEANNYIPELPYSLNIEEIVSHISGLIPWLPLYLYRESYLQTILEKGFKGEKGTKVYSCLNYILLKEIIEIKLGISFKKAVLSYLQSFKNCFLPPLNCVNVAPTERGNVFELNIAKKFVSSPDRRKFRLNRVIKGETHDLNSHYAGGIAGNSGLFADVFGVISLVKSFLKSDNWRLPLFEKGDYFYHLGFTGTGIAIYKDKSVSVVFLSNRVCPEVKEIDFSLIRHKIFEKMFEKFV